MDTYELKKFSYYHPEPKAIHCLQVNVELQKLALSRSNNVVEIWDLKQTPHLDRVLIVDKNDSVESIAWCNVRLFTAGLAGSVLEHDILNVTVRQEVPVTSGSCWCIDVSGDKQFIAAGTEEGYINIIRIHDDGLILEKLMDKQEGRILCIAWEMNDYFLATGSVDAVRVWNVKTGHAIHKLTPGRSEINKPTVIWCLTVADNFTIITGDSRGKVTFWDGHQGLQIDSHQSHKADILSVCLNADKNKLYCAGVDPLIASFEKTNVRGSGNAENYKWIRSIQRIIHDHDVRALTINDDKLYSGGVDGYLASSSYPPKVLIKYSPMLQTRRISLAFEANLLLITYDEHLEVWHWSPKVSSFSHVAMIKSYKNKFIRCSSISPDGTWIVYSTEQVVRLLKFALVDDSIRREVKRVSSLPTKLKSVAVCFCFSADNKYLAAADKNRNITIVELKSDENVRLVALLNAESAILKDFIHMICISENSEFIVVADRSSNIAIWKNFKYFCSMPKSNSAPTAMAINRDQTCIVVAYADHKIVEFNINKKKFTSFSRTLDQKHPIQWLNRQFPVEGILFDRNNQNVIMVFDDTTICIIDKTKKLPEARCKIPRLEVRSPDNSDNSESSSSQISLSRSDNLAFHILKEFKHLVYLNAFDNNELLAVEVNPNTLTKKLPTLLLRKRFGIM